MDEVLAYVKNDHLGFTIPYTHRGRPHEFLPDFIVRIDDGHGDRRPAQPDRRGLRPSARRRSRRSATAARTLWVPGVNNLGGFGRWAVHRDQRPVGCASGDPRPHPPDQQGVRAGMTPLKGTKSKTAGPTPVEIDPPQGQADQHPDQRAARIRRRRGERAPSRCSIRAIRPSTRSSSGRARTSRTAQDLEVPAVPIYIQEKIHPAGASSRTCARPPQPDEPEPEPSLFADFNGIEFEELVDFYQHEQNWSNRLILGDSLLVMTCSPRRRASRARSRRSTSTRPTASSSAPTGRCRRTSATSRTASSISVTRQPEQIRAFRDTWKLGIHSYLAYLRDRWPSPASCSPRSGSIFVQIGDENVHLVRSLLDEVFGARTSSASSPSRRPAAQAARPAERTSSLPCPIISSGTPARRARSSTGRCTGHERLVALAEGSTRGSRKPMGPAAGRWRRDRHRRDGRSLVQARQRHFVRSYVMLFAALPLEWAMRRQDEET